MLPPYELKNKDFSKVMRGYNTSEVDEHLAFVIEKYTELYRENDELERKLKTAYAKLDEIKNEEESIRSAMVNAQRASTKIMTEANDRADIIINTARKSCDRILADFKAKIQEERAVLLALNKSITEFKEKLFKLYNAQIASVEEIELLNEKDITKYALSEDSYTSAVVQNIKQQIIELTKEVVPENNESDKKGFVEADIVIQEPNIRLNNVKDTIKELNKRFLDDNNSETEKEIASPPADHRTDAEIEAEKEYDEVLKQLGADKSVDLDSVFDDDASSKNKKNNDFNSAYRTPDNYAETFKKKKQ